jgi:hypothetical protein
MPAPAPHASGGKPMTGPGMPVTGGRAPKPSCAACAGANGVAAGAAMPCPTMSGPMRFIAGKRAESGLHAKKGPLACLRKPKPARAALSRWTGIRPEGPWAKRFFYVGLYVG